MIYAGILIIVALVAYYIGWKHGMNEMRGWAEEAMEELL